MPHALISGGSSGIGLKLAEKLFAKGWNVSLIARGLTRPPSLALAAIGRGQGAHGLKVVGGLWQSVHAGMVAPSRGSESRGQNMSANEETIANVREAIVSIVRKLVENENASFPFLVAAVGLNGTIWYGRVELVDAHRGHWHTIAEKVVEGGFTFPINIMCIDGRGKGYLAVICAGDIRIH